MRTQLPFALFATAVACSLATAPAHARARVFAASYGVGEGTGLGLSISHDIVNFAIRDTIVVNNDLNGILRDIFRRDIRKSRSTR